MTWWRTWGPTMVVQVVVGVTTGVIDAPLWARLLIATCVGVPSLVREIQDMYRREPGGRR